MAVEKTKLNGVLPVKSSIFEDFRGNYATRCVIRRCSNTDKLKALTGFEAKEMLGDVFRRCTVGIWKNTRRWIRRANCYDKKA